MKQESERCTFLRSLIAPQELNEQWFENVSGVLRYRKHLLKKTSYVLSRFHPAYGKVHITGDAVFWERPDRGPAISDTSPIPPSVRIVRAMLRGELILELSKNKMLSYVEVGYPAEWKRTKVYRNGEEQKLVTWACAILGHVCTVDEAKELKDQTSAPKNILYGHVAIVLQERPQSFF